MRKTDWLQLFAQPEEPAQAGENAGDTAPDAGERQEDFEDLIRGRYKADFDARVRKILDGRLRGLRQEVAQLRQWERERDLRHQAAMDGCPARSRRSRGCIRNSGGSGRWTTPALHGSLTREWSPGRPMRWYTAGS